jgi:hypothetical protein
MRLLIIGGMLALAVSVSRTPANAAWGHGGPRSPPNEGGCDSWFPDDRVGAIGCHCWFQCRRQYSYVVRLPCLNYTPPFCDVTVHPVETVHACFTTCKAKEATRH